MPKGGPQRKDPNAPKKPATSFFLWLGENRGRISEELGTKKVSEVAKMGGLEWKELKDKSKWEQMAAQDKVRYEQEMQDYGGGA